MTRNARKDDNDFPTIFGLSCVDGVTPVRVTFNASNGGMNYDTTTVISFTPSSTFPQVDDNSMPIAKGVSSTNPNVILPWYVVPSTGAVLVQFV